jgi:hypothetical protein
MCTRELSMVQRFASNVCGFMPRIHRMLLKCVAGVIVSLVLSITIFADLLPRGCDVETVDALQHLAPVGCHCR